jgi:gamma-glutamyl:cysteine ligase YbdK (ATP-grasp superfamily)
MSAAASSRAGILVACLTGSDAWRVAASSFSRPYNNCVNRCGHRRRGTYPLWARWDGEPGRSYTLGLEEELMLLQSDDSSPAQASDEVPARLSDELSRHASPETHAAVVELATGVHPHLDGLIGELGSLRIRLLNGLRRRIPVLLALSANSPFWQARDSGFASARTFIFQAFPRAGSPRFFANYGECTAAVDALIASAAVRDPTFLWWDIRLQPKLGTVQVRVMDAQSTVGEVAPNVALIQSLSRLELEGHASPVMPVTEVLVENRFLAARDGMHAQLIDPETQRLIPVRQMLDVLLAECRPHALALGCAGALERLTVTNGADRQRAFAARNRPLQNLVARLADRFITRDRRLAAPRETA